MTIFGNPSVVLLIFGMIQFKNVMDSYMGASINYVTLFGGRGSVKSHGVLCGEGGVYI